MFSGGLLPTQLYQAVLGTIPKFNIAPEKWWLEGVYPYIFETS